MQAVFSMALKVARFDSTVLITGESGTGKELVAQGIHRESDRRSGPMVAVNCASIPESLMESELFGHVKGAFTGADRDKKGLFDAADGGTLFLDEVGDIPLSLQPKLLRVLQEGEIRPVGGAKTRAVNVRVIAATSKDLEREMAGGHFREDLFYRLNVVPIQLPPLRERPEDIPLLCRFFINRFNETLGSGIQNITSAAVAELMGYHWPGNIRELENSIERAIVLTDRATLTADSFGFGSTGAVVPDRESGKGPLGFSLKVARVDLEKKMIRKALAATGGNRTHAAHMLEISHPSLLNKMKAYGIE
jgi:two-component system, NtrC family, response regulator AtoC